MNANTPGIVVALALAAILTPAIGEAQDQPIPLFVALVDFDCLADTLYGLEAGEMGFLPTSIVFGTGDDSCHGGKRAERAELEFRYPPWRNIRGNVTILDVSRDARQDLVISFRGVPENSRRDSSRTVILLGQNALSSAGAIDLERIGRGLSSAPVITLDADDIPLLKAPLRRDLSGTLSHVWESIAVGTLGITPTGSTAEKSREIWSQLYPNPAIYATTLEIARIPPGDYSVRLVGLDGAPRIEQSVSIAPEQALLSNLDLSALAAGYYLVVVDRGRNRFGSWPVLVTR